MRVPEDAQGELQGALSSITSLTSIIGPVLMTQLFARFTGQSAPLYFPGISFVVAAILTGLCLLIFSVVVMRHGLTQLGKSGIGETDSVMGSE